MFVSPGIIDAGDDGICGIYKMENDVWYDVELRVCPQHSELLVDGKEVASHTPRSIPGVYAFTGYDERSQELVIKVVNCSGKSKNMDIHIDHAISVADTGKAVVLSSEHDTDENSFASPDKIRPVVYEQKGFGKSFRYAFRPYSYTILRIKSLR